MYDKIGVCIVLNKLNRGKLTVNLTKVIQLYLMGHHIQGIYTETCELTNRNI